MTPNEKKVFDALLDPDWNRRTTAGISKASGLSESEVKAILESNPEIIRKSALPDEQGRDLFFMLVPERLAVWDKKISDPKERKLFEALSDPAWDFRTVVGISNASGLSESEISEVLHKYPELIRKSGVPDAKGRELFALSSKAVSAKEQLALAWRLVAKSFR